MNIGRHKHSEARTAARPAAIVLSILFTACLGPDRTELEDGGGHGQSTDGSTPDAGRTPRDGGTAQDGGIARDGGTAQDGGTARDGGTAWDGGIARDGGATADGGARPDGGGPDGGARDAGRGPDDAGIDVPPGYALAWSDEFSSPGAPDPKNWSFERGFVRNHELQWYQPENASVRDGLLVIEARREHVVNPNYQTGSSDWKVSRQYAEYTSASLLTFGLHAWKYGRLELRARIPTSSGLWPAWWTLGQSGEWPSNGEVDIMEYYRGMLLANVACGTTTRWTAKWDSSTTPLSSLGADWPSSFHVWRMDWDEDTIALFVDGALLNSVPLSSMLNPDGTSPFRQPHYMILNLAIGGDNGGDPASTPFPARYEIDYVRVFQKT